MPLISQIESDQQHVIRQICRLTRLPTRWNGNIVFTNELNPDGSPRYFGGKNWDCKITLHTSILDTIRRYSTGIHEGFHSVSVGLDERAYSQYKGIEEAVVEQCTRLFRTEILEGLHLTEPLEKRFSYNHYIENMESLRVRTGKESKDFYLSLLRIPLAQRERVVVKWIEKTYPDTQALFLDSQVEEALRHLKGVF